ncbi:MAG: aconitate hydratase AcnA [Pseudohongiellaceae bacterium]
MSKNSFGARATLDVGGKEYDYFSLPAAREAGLGGIDRLPVSLKILLENLLRFEDDNTVKREDIEALAVWAEDGGSDEEIAYRPARVLMQDFTGVPAVADLAAMRSAVVEAGHDAALINPVTPVDLVIDHSVMVDKFGNADAFEDNVNLEMARNAERYRFLRWGQLAFDNFRVVPPGTGICHQVNLEYLARVVWTREEDGRTVALPDTLVGTDSHTTMINGLGVLGWGVGGIEAEAAMLGQPISMLIPDVVGFKLSGALSEGITATDLVLTVVEMLRQKGVVGKFVEFYGDGLNQLPLADRATIANMAPEYGATCGFFPVDSETITYLKLTNRPPETVALVEAYAKAQGLWREPGAPDAVYSDKLALDLSEVVPSLAGPKRPQDRVAMSELKGTFTKALEQYISTMSKAVDKSKRIPVPDTDYDLGHGDVVIAAITSCTNTSNPAVMLGAGLLAKKAVKKGIKVKPWVKTSLAPGSKVVTEYLEKTGVQQYLNELGFNLVGYGCTTCIGNSGPLPPPITAAIHDGKLMVSSVLSGNRNFEGRVHQEVRANWLASPPLVVAYALAGTTRIDLSRDPISQDSKGNDIFLKDLWPNNAEIAEAAAQVSAAMFERQYADVFSGPLAWQSIKINESDTYSWDKSTYIKQPPFFSASKTADNNLEVQGAHILALLGDSVTTDHISPAGAIQPDSPAGQYLQKHGVEIADFNSYGSRRGNHEVMMRGTFANIRIRNEMVPGVEGGYTRYVSAGASAGISEKASAGISEKASAETKEQLSIFDAAMRYKDKGTPLVVIAGKEYGTGSSRDWAAKGTRLLGVKAVITESFERIHRSNLIGMGVLPLVFKDGQNRKTLNLTGTETIDIRLPDGTTTITPRQDLELIINDGSRDVRTVTVMSRLDTDNEIAYFRNNGILQYVLNNLTKTKP